MSKQEPEMVRVIFRHYRGFHIEATDIRKDSKMIDGRRKSSVYWRQTTGLTESEKQELFLKIEKHKSLVEEIRRLEKETENLTREIFDV